MAESARVVPLRRVPQPQESQQPQPQPSQPQLRQPHPQQPQPQEPQRPQLQPPAPAQEPRPQEPLWREALGRRLRALRQDRDETLAETAARAGLSPQYLSEIERGRKEPSSEMIAALAGALDTTLVTLAEQVAGDLRRHQALVLRVGRADIQRAQHHGSSPVILGLAA